MVGETNCCKRARSHHADSGPKFKLWIQLWTGCPDTLSWITWRVGNGGVVAEARGGRRMQVLRCRGKEILNWMGSESLRDQFHFAHFMNSDHKNSFSLSISDRLLTLGLRFLDVNQRSSINHIGDVCQIDREENHSFFEPPRNRAMRHRDQLSAVSQRMSMAGTLPMPSHRLVICCVY